MTTLPSYGGALMIAGEMRARPTARQMLNKVPEITLYFWIIKVLCTTVGETAADYLNTNLGLGLSGTSYVMSAVLIAEIGRHCGRRSNVEKCGRRGAVLRTQQNLDAAAHRDHAIEDALKVPVLFIGVGEKMDDLLDFDPNAFVEALLG